MTVVPGTDRTPTGADEAAAGLRRDQDRSDTYRHCVTLAFAGVAVEFSMLRSEAGRNPYDKKLVELIGELSTRSEDFRTRWAAHNVRFHRTGQS